MTIILRILHAPSWFLAQIIFVIAFFQVDNHIISYLILVMMMMLMVVMMVILVMLVMLVLVNLKL